MLLNIIQELYQDWFIIGQVQYYTPSLAFLYLANQGQPHTLNVIGSPTQRLLFLKPVLLFAQTKNGAGSVAPHTSSGDLKGGDLNFRVPMKRGEQPRKLITC